MKYKKFDVVIAPFPFVDKVKKQKIRPSVIVSSNEYYQRTGLVVVAMITSAKNSKLWNDIKIINAEKSELSEGCVVRMKFSNIIDDKIIKKIGTIGKNEIAQLRNHLAKIFD